MNNIESLIDSGTYKYKPAEKAELDERYDDFLDNCNITAVLKTESERLGVGVCDSAVDTVIEQVRKQALYFYIYHGIEELGDLKEAALYCYWILKLQPFYWGKRHESNPNYELNAKVALRFFVEGVNTYIADETAKAAKNGVKVKFGINMDDKIFQNLYYSFRFMDWNEESLVDLAESLITREHNA
ncbi:hypothetical protein R80B4_00086 [Fibrobacteres bacterium R8-0-B4]